MTNTLLKLTFVFIISVIIPSSWSFAGETQRTVAPRTTLALKQYMSRFGTMVAGIELMREQSKKPDWEIIKDSLDTMHETLNEMKKADPQNGYFAYTSTLEKQLILLEKAAQEHNKKFYQSFDEFLDTCFTCHKTHRPADFLTQPQ